MARLQQGEVAQVKRQLRMARRLKRNTVMDTPVRVSADRLVLAAERRLKTFDRARWN